MAGISYPTSLPGPVRNPRRAAERRGLSTGPGPLQARARSRDWLADHELEFVYTPAEMAIFKDWWQDTLQYGGAWFAAHAWPSADPAVGGVYQFKGGVRTVHRGLGIQRVMAAAQERGRGVDPQQLVCFYENFSDGLGPYTSPSGGGLARFEIVSSPYGAAALRYIGATSATDYNIARAVPDSPFETFSAKFLVESASVDDSAYMIVGRTIGGEAINLRPRTEVHVDAAQRARLAIGSGATYLGASAIALNVWHEITATRAGTYVLTRLDTYAVVAAGTLTTGYGSSQQVNGLAFVEDSNLGSCSTQFADIEICPPAEA
jgi:hypothetical protein